MHVEFMTQFKAASGLLSRGDLLGRPLAVGLGSPVALELAAAGVRCLGAMEAIKCITGMGEPLFNRMLLMDLQSMKMREM